MINIRQGARAYYMRNILHDWPDDKCVEILRNIKAGMTEQSRLMIDEMVLPERGTPWRATQLDMLMTCIQAAKERSHAEWIELLDEAGFKILSIRKYTQQLDDCVIIAVPKSL
jgi:demethylsterigmatocystin 6-O-methyltransferase